MASVGSINIDGKEIYLKLRISPEEYKDLQGTKRVLIFSWDSDEPRDSLTLGKLGNSYRIMLPKKLLRTHNIDKIPKKAEAQVFERMKEKYLIIKLKESGMGIPVFEGGDVVE